MADRSNKCFVETSSQHHDPVHFQVGPVDGDLSSSSSGDDVVADYVSGVGSSGFGSLNNSDTEEASDSEYCESEGAFVSGSSKESFEKNFEHETEEEEDEDESTLSTSSNKSVLESEGNDTEGGEADAKELDGNDDDDDIEENADPDNMKTEAKDAAKKRHFSFGALTKFKKQQSSSALRTDPKQVRFADALGLDLVHIQTFLPEDQKYQLPAVIRRKVKTLVPCFAQPGSLPEFFDILRENKVCLENAFQDQENFSVRGIVRVLNIDYHKAVYIRWTQDDWMTMRDYRASYVKGSNDAWTDKFQFKIYAPLDTGQSLAFAVRYHCAGEQFWDNNRRQNYKFLCIDEEKEFEEE